MPGAYVLLHGRVERCDQYVGAAHVFRASGGGVNRNKARGTAFERLVADYLAARLGDDRIDRMPLRGSLDRGDITGVRTVLGERVAVEVKNVSRLDLAGWVDEAVVEAGNGDAAVAVVVHKRRGKGRAGDQYVTMRLCDLAVLLGAEVES